MFGSSLSAIKSPEINRILCIARCEKTETKIINWTENKKAKRLYSGPLKLVSLLNKLVPEIKLMQKKIDNLFKNIILFWIV